eukprot:202409-Heterocapsa_arctica.AAC.1
MEGQNARWHSYLLQCSVTAPRDVTATPALQPGRRGKSGAVRPQRACWGRWTARTTATTTRTVAKNPLR